MSSDDLGSKVSGAGFALPDLAAELADETASIIELTGAIKWFDVSKGYGFIIPDNGLPDVLLHVTCLRRDGYQTAYEGARIVCEVLQRPKGLRIPHARRRHARHFRAHGNSTPVRPDRAAAGSDRAGALWPGAQGHDG